MKFGSISNEFSKNGSEFSRPEAKFRTKFCKVPRTFIAKFLRSQEKIRCLGGNNRRLFEFSFEMKFPLFLFKSLKINAHFGEFVIKDLVIVVIVPRGYINKRMLDRLSHDIESLSIVDCDVSTAILPVFYQLTHLMLTQHLTSTNISGR